MAIATRVLARATRVPRARTTDVRVERDLEAKMPDGAVLLADRWYAPSGVGTDPVVIIRSPYGRRPFGLLGRFFAERGYQAIVQSVRGTFGSGGQFRPFHHERSDGTATLEWVAGQPWFTGRAAMYGPSYLGYVQWAVASRPPAFLKAMAPQATAANMRDAVIYPGGAFSLESGATWAHQIEFQEQGWRKALWSMATSRSRMEAAFSAVPLEDADRAALGRRIEFYQDWLVHERPGDPWWDPLNCSIDLDAAPPMSLVAGWYDLFLPEQVADYTRLRDAGREVRLTIGPWTHGSARAGAYAFRDALEWFDVHLRGQRAPEPRKPVRLWVAGSRRWLDVDDWPPPARTQRWHLQPGGEIAPRTPEPSPADPYRYDPRDPTPSRGGATLDMFHAGPRNQRVRETRPDVLVYTSAPFTSGLTLTGPLSAEIWFRSSRQHTDVFVRLCEVDARGRSRNLSDGILRLEPAEDTLPGDGIRRVHINMWPIAHTFRRGTRLRLQVSSAAHPLFARNTNSGEPLATATTLLPADQEVFHDPAHPSGIDLPVSTIL